MNAIILSLLAVSLCLNAFLLLRKGKGGQTTNERQAQALSTCMSSCRNISYPSLGGAEEISEYWEKLVDIIEWNPSIPDDDRKFILSWARQFIQSGKQLGTFAKKYRHIDFVPFYIPQLSDTASVSDRAAHNEKLRKLRLEVGDLKWMVLCADFYVVYRAGVTLDAEHPATAQETDGMNWEKLSRRKREHTIDGKGDEKRTHI